MHAPISDRYKNFLSCSLFLATKIEKRAVGNIIAINVAIVNWDEANQSNNPSKVKRKKTTQPTVTAKVKPTAQNIFFKLVGHN